MTFLPRRVGLTPLEHRVVTTFGQKPADPSPRGLRSESTSTPLADYRVFE